MELTIHIKVAGLDRLSAALLALAGGIDQNNFYVAPRKTEQPDTAPVQQPAPAPAMAAPNPFQAPAASMPAGAAGNAAASAGTSVQPAPPAVSFGSTPGAAPAPAAPTSARTYTRDEIAQPAGQWCYGDPSKAPERSAALNALNAEFGVQGLDQLPPEQYGAYVLRLRQLGVSI